MKYRVNLGNISKPNVVLLDNLVQAKKAIRDKLKQVCKGVRIESSVSKIEHNVFGLGYRYPVSDRITTSGIYRIEVVKD